MHMRGKEAQDKTPKNSRYENKKEQQGLKCDCSHLRGH